MDDSGAAVTVVVGFSISNANQGKGSESIRRSGGRKCLVNCISRNLADTDLAVKQIGEKATELAEGLSVK